MPLKSIVENIDKYCACFAINKSIFGKINKHCSCFTAIKSILEIQHY